MKFTLLFLFFICLSTVSVFAQDNYLVKGVAADSVEHVKLYNTSISVLNAKDSTLVNFTRAGEDGTFSIKNLHKGKFILLVVYPDYADYVENFSLDSVNQTHNFGNINMNLKSRILKEVLIKGTAAQIKIKGDTTEFNAAAFKIQPNAKVEDLLKQLPGIQVDKDGKITAQGETVNKVLVDGEEFFGDDPTLVTKNIRADMVDKVQLYDKKSDQAAFTGIDDGQKTKTLNIKLKEDKKNGYFGKADAGVGTDGYYAGELLYNRFHGKQKFSFFGIAGNDGKTSLGWQDAQKYGTSSNVTFGDDGSIYITGNNSDDLDNFNGSFNGQGIPTARNAGVHYDDKWNSDKESINTNYKIGSLGVDGSNNTLSQSDVPGIGAINSNSNSKSHNYIFRQKLDITYQIKLDTTQTLKFSVDGTEKHSQTVSSYTQTQKLANDSLINSSTRNISNKVDGKIFDASALYTKKFKKKGRTFSLNVSESYNDSQAKGYLKSDVTNYSTTGKTDSIIDQYKTNDIRSSVFNTNMTYTEPLSKTLSVIFNYGIGVDNSSADRKSFNQSAPRVYNVLDSLYSNNFELDQLSNTEGAVINYKKGKTIFNFGTKVSEVKFKQINEYNDNVFQRNFLNWNPQAYLQHRFSQQSAININYWGSTTQPSVEQIQPILVNTDPLNVTVGNPNLTPSFTNRFNLWYNSYKVMSDQSMYINANYSFTSNPIVASSVTDTSATSTTRGKTTTQYVNIGNKVPYIFGTNIYYGRKLPGTELNIGGNLSAYVTKSYSISNTEMNAIGLNTYAINLRISKYVQKKYDFNISFGPTYTVGGSSLLPGLNNNGHGLSGEGGFTVYLPAKFQISSDANYEYNSKTETFNQDFSRLLLNAAISKSFFKEENFKISIKGNDLLNQNAGFTRSVNGNLVSQSNYTTIRRYFMLSVSWDFNKVGGGTSKK